MALAKANIKIRGTRPLWWHAFGPNALPLERQERTGVAGNNPEEWRETLLATKDGQLYVNGSYLFGAIRDGARYTKSGRGSLMGAISATLQIISDRVLIDRYYPGFPNGHNFDAKIVEVPEKDPSLPVYLDVRSVVNPSTKGRNIRYRVASCPGWEAEFEIQWELTVVSEGQMLSILNDSGTLVGIGSGRAIGMGRYEIVSFEKVD